MTAEDVGTSVEDMASVFSTTRHTTCIPPELGGSGNPSVPTARGIVCAIEAGLEHLGMGTLAGKSVAVQGLGHVGLPLAKFLAERGVARIVATDIFAANIDAARAELGGAVKDLDLRCVERGDNSVLAAEVESSRHSLRSFSGLLARTFNALIPFARAARLHVHNTLSRHGSLLMHSTHLSVTRIRSCATAFVV